MQRRRRITFGAAAVALLTAAPASGSGPRPAGQRFYDPTSFTYWTSGFKPAEIATVDSAFDKAYPSTRPKASTSRRPTRTSRRSSPP